MGESQLFISLVPPGVNEARDPGSAAQTARLVAEIAPHVGCSLDVLEAGVYWGANRPVLGALQAAATLGSLPLQARTAAPPHPCTAAPLHRRTAAPPHRRIAVCAAPRAAPTPHSCYPAPVAVRQPPRARAHPRAPAPSAGGEGSGAHR